MKTLSGSRASDLELAHDVLDTLGQLIDAALRHLNSLCVVDGRLSQQLLDQYQLPCYEVSFCTADHTAARHLVDYAVSVCAQDDVAAWAACQFAATSVQSVMGRLAARPVEYGMGSDDIADALRQLGEAGFADFYLASERMAELGQALMAREGDYVPMLLTDEQREIRDAIRRFSTNVVMELAEDIHRHDRDVPEEILQPLREMGCFGISIPERFGGLQSDSGDDSLYMILATEELSRGSLGAAGSLITRPEILARALLTGGTSEQQKRWLPLVASGEVLCAISLTEPDYGSDLASVKLKATRTDGGWLLNGSKTWCTFAGTASLIVTLARTGDESDGHKGLSCFLVKKPRCEGQEFEVRQDPADGAGHGKLTGKAIPTIGYRGMHSFDLFFEDFFVSGEDVIGEEAGVGKGFYFVLTGLTGGRMQTAARASGVMQAACEQAVEYAGNRKVFGQPIGGYQLTRINISRMVCALLAAKHFSYAVARQVDAGGGRIAASLVKLFACRAAEWVASTSLQIHGGMGYAEEVPVSRYFVDARVLSIFEGTEEVLALRVIAKELVISASNSDGQTVSRRPLKT